MTALRIDVADLLAHSGARRRVELAVPAAGLNGSVARVPDGEPVILDLVLQRIPDGIVARGSIASRWQGQCSHCLAALDEALTLEAAELFEPAPLEGDTYPIEGHEIDLTQLVRDAVILELPLAPLCRGRCAHPSVPPAGEDVPDPRWAALSELEL